MSTSTGNSGLLRKAMRANGAFSTLSALVCLFLAQGIVIFLGLEPEDAPQITSLGLSLLIFAAFLFVASSKLTEDKQTFLLVSGGVAVVLDLLWVIGSIFVLVLGLMPLTGPGQWVVAVLAVFVLDFAIFQSLGIKRLMEKRVEV